MSLIAPMRIAISLPWTVPTIASHFLAHSVFASHNNQDESCAIPLTVSQELPQNPELSWQLLAPWHLLQQSPPMILPVFTLFRLITQSSAILLSRKLTSGPLHRECECFPHFSLAWAQMLPPQRSTLCPSYLKQHPTPSHISLSWFILMAFINLIYL